MPPFSPSVERDDAPPIDLEDYLAPDPESGEERPTFGARIAGDVPKPIPPNVAAPEDKQPAPPVQYDPGKVPEGIFAPKSPPPAPVGANNPALELTLIRPIPRPESELLFRSTAWEQGCGFSGA
jgi:hypothetical protein